MGSIGLGLLVGSLAQILFPAIPALMVIAGIYLLIRNMRGEKHVEAVEATPIVKSDKVEFEPITPKAGPEADR
jgi:hypothetical protein